MRGSSHIQTKTSVKEFAQALSNSRFVGTDHRMERASSTVGAPPLVTEHALL
jgi:hypothetical protein